MAAAAVGLSVLSGVFQVVFDRIAPNQKFLLGLFPGNNKPGLQKLDEALNRLEEALLTISVVLEDAENKQERTPAVKNWFNSLKRSVYQAEDLLDEINTERLRSKIQHSEVKLSDEFIGELSPRLEKICAELERKVKQIGVLGLQILNGKQKREDKPPSTSVVIQSEIFGREDEKEKIIKMVLSSEGGKDVSVIPITGMGGVGKTTLAQLVYSDERVMKKGQFDARAWVCVSEEFDVQRSTRDLLMDFNPSVVDEKDDLNRLQVKLEDNVKGKRFIIILDDIWNDNYDDYQRLMTPLNSGSRGSKIIVTTRNEKIARMLQNEKFQHLDPIDDDQSWSLFKLHAFNNRPLTFNNRPLTLSREFETFGRIIVKRCKGLPLAIKTVAGALRSKDDIQEWLEISSSETWMGEGDILPALSLSYKLLPSHLKCCFDFCAVFPKDVPFDKDVVALLWMANDLVQPSSQKVARNYFEELRSRSFFEMANDNMYVMHDLVNDLARIVSGNFCARLEDYRGIQRDNELQPEVLHFSYLTSRHDTLERFRGLSEIEGLRTFLHVHQLDYRSLISTLFFSDILPKFRHIRALSLHHYFILVIPDSIGDLKHLRFLNLAWTYIKKLPNDITKCLNLQTLILTDCSELEELPEDIGLLINLQYLDVRRVGYNLIDKMETWLSKLEDIQNLSVVVDAIHGNAIEQLDKLQLGQLLRISDLDNAFTIEMAKNVQLKNKNCIKLLSLGWRGNPECSADELNIFAELIPHTNIRQLCIEGYRGTTFSNWLGDSSFCNIQSLTLRDCKKCFHLPPLGQLTGLKKLEISSMDVITEVGEEFYGNSSTCKPFPVLEELIFSNMAEWTTWNMHPHNADFLSLKEFQVTDCPKLIGDIPFHLTSLRELKMSGLHSLHCNQEGSFLFSTLQGEKSSDLLKLDNCNSPLESLRVDRCGDSTETIRLFSFSKLQKLKIISCESLHMFQFPDGNHQSLTSLQSLTISDCNNLLSFPKGGLPIPNLKEFVVSRCNNLKSLPEQMHTQLSSLSRLRIENCPEMECFPDGCLPTSLDTLRILSCKKMAMFPRNWDLQRLPSLIELDIAGIEDKLFPEEGLLPRSLQILWISGCPNLEALNHTAFQDISLTELYIIRCPELRYLPEDGLPSSLFELCIVDCPKLKARIEREKGEDWPKICHIPIIHVDNELIS